MTWKDGETISPLGLNRIEEAVASMNESYTPTVWEVGDVITAEKLNKIEEGIAGVPVPSGKKVITTTEEVNVASYATAQVVDEDLIAGNIKKDVDILGVVGSYEGGANDFDTATITLVPSGNYFQDLLVVAIVADKIFVSNNPPAGSFQTPLYKGVGMASYEGVDIEKISVTGGATLDQGIITITGDCTITMVA